MTELKQTEIDFETAVDSPVFKLKVTNIRKSAYPTNTPEYSDYLRVKIGDYLVKYHGGNTIYEVVDIVREPIAESRIDDYLKKIKGYGGGYVDNKLANLLEGYRKNGNFGACRISVKAILRKDKEVVKGKLVKFLDVEQHSSILWNNYQKVELKDIIKTRDYYITRMSDDILARTKKLDVQVSMKKAVEKLMYSKQTPLQVVSTVEVVEDQQAEAA